MRMTMLALALCVPTAAYAEDGALLFKTYCSTCHGESGKGDGVAARRFAQETFSGSFQSPSSPASCPPFQSFFSNRTAPWS